MSASVELSDIYQISNSYRLQHEASQDAWVLLYPEGMVKLNPSAAEILKRLDGESDLRKIIEALEKEFEQTGLENDVLSFTEIALEQKWIRLTDG